MTQMRVYEAIEFENEADGGNPITVQPGDYNVTATRSGHTIPGRDTAGLPVVSWRVEGAKIGLSAEDVEIARAAGKLTIEE